MLGYHSSVKTSYPLRDVDLLVNNSACILYNSTHQTDNCRPLADPMRTMRQGQKTAILFMLWLPEDWDAGNYTFKLIGVHHYNNTIRDLLNDYAYSNEVEDVCRESGDESLLIDSGEYYLGNDQYDYSNAPVFHEMTIPNGTAMKLIAISTLHTYTSTYWDQFQQSNIHWTLNGFYPNGCRGISSIVNFHYDECSDYYGGWEEIHLDFQLIGSVYPDSEFSFTMYYQMVPVTSVL